MLASYIFFHDILSTTVAMYNDDLATVYQRNIS
jgi:hypothetical protein